MNKSRPDSMEERAYHHGDLRRSLIKAAVEILTENQDWTFSLREVARRAGVSHNAPYNHFEDKRDLLAEVAAAGFETLRERMLAAIPRIEDAETALTRAAVVYVRFGIENPAHYRLMFGSVVVTKRKDRPMPLMVAGNNARAVLEEIIHRGAEQGVFTVSPKKKEELRLAVLSAWSAVHGLTMLAIDGLAEAPRLTMDGVARKLSQTLCYGLIRR
jgi:AcrR family transcriptional regulator